MKCPNCEYKISIFSKDANIFKPIQCPNCNQSLQLKINWKRAIKWAPIIIVLSVLIRKFLFPEGAIHDLIFGIGGGIIAVLSLDLKKRE
jgi:DNA-directed RNA polymerase subunit RPC12/RpoP